MTRRLTVIFLAFFLFWVFQPATADTIIYHTLSSDDGLAPFEPVETVQSSPFPPDAALLTVDFLDRGAADSILLQCGGESLLVDGGLYGLRTHVIDILSYLQISHFTYMLNTHAHDDHIEGLISLLLRDYLPDEYLSCYPDDYRGSEYYTRVRELLSEKNVPYRRIGDGDRFTLGSAQITVYRDETPNIDKNRHSIVLKVVLGKRSILLMADAIGRTQEYLLSKYDPSEFQADVFKYPHHGYVNMTYAFLDAIDPSLSVITNSRKSAALADQQLAYRGIPRYYTNQGAVHLQTDGRIWQAQQMPWSWPRD